jgi:UDP-N-acetylmuramyl pentapeptide phosphotransferase/UDP-N-acetylglucosamine-1-phosphate transferase
MSIPSRSSYELVYFCLFLAASVVSVLLTKWIRNLAKRHELVVGPLNDRHIHTRPIPRMGGVSIYLTVASFLLFLEFVAKRISSQLSVHSAILILIPGTFLFLVGLYDDLRGLSAKLKFAAQILAGSNVVRCWVQGVGTAGDAGEQSVRERYLAGRNHLLGVVDLECI